MQSPGRWQRAVHVVGQSDVGHQVLEDLVRGDVALVVLKNLLPREDFETGLGQVRRHFEKVSTTRYINGALTTLGPYLASHLSNPAKYFADAASTHAELDKAGFELDTRIQQRLKEVLGLRSFEPEHESDGRVYSPSIIRIHADGVRNPLHNDNIMRDGAASGLRLARLKHHLSCVVCLQECDTGGELFHYFKKWHPDDEVFKIKGGLGYDEEVVRGAALHEFKPQAGDVYLLNPTYYHSIERVGGTDRITMGFFFGFYDDSLTDGVVWS